MQRYNGWVAPSVAMVEQLLQWEMFGVKSAANTPLTVARLHRGVLYFLGAPLMG